MVDEIQQKQKEFEKKEEQMARSQKEKIEAASKKY